MAWPGLEEPDAVVWLELGMGFRRDDGFVGLFVELGKGFGAAYFVRSFVTFV